MSENIVKIKISIEGFPETGLEQVSEDGGEKYIEFSFNTDDNDQQFVINAIEALQANIELDIEKNMPKKFNGSLDSFFSNDDVMATHVKAGQEFKEPRWTEESWKGFIKAHLEETYEKAYDADFFYEEWLEEGYQDTENISNLVDRIIVAGDKFGFCLDELMELTVIQIRNDLCAFCDETDKSDIFDVIGHDSTVDIASKVREFDDPTKDLFFVAKVKLQEWVLSNPVGRKVIAGGKFGEHNFENGESKLFDSTKPFDMPAGEMTYQSTKSCGKCPPALDNVAEVKHVQTAKEKIPDIEYGI